MSKSDKIIIIGFGSIGQRHYRNLLSLGYKNIAVYDPDDRRFIKKNVERLSYLTKKILTESDIAFICNPNNKHIKTAIQCAKTGCHLFIEKPLSHNLRGVKELEDMCRKRELITMVGCNMRFHPCLKFIKHYLGQKKLGRVYGIYHEFGYYLPYWRPGQDYRKNYAAKRSSGGGIILDDIHEFDLLFWLNNFSPFLEKKFIFNKAGDLEIETEDNCIATFKFTNKVLGSVRCDYLQQYYSRGCKVVGQRGNLVWDFNENIVWLKNKVGEKKLLVLKNFDFNQIYLEEVKYFMRCVKDKQPSFNNLALATEVLKYCLKK